MRLFVAILIALATSCAPAIVSAPGAWVDTASRDLDRARAATEVAGVLAALTDSATQLATYRHDTSPRTRCALAASLRCSVHRMAEVAAVTTDPRAGVFQAIDQLQADLDSVDPGCPTGGPACPSP